VVPRTTVGWGVTAVGAAFAFLGIGAYISLRQPPGADEPIPAAGAGTEAAPGAGQ
jgi:hypothetical protein